jgi:hypothetical protein
MLRVLADGRPHSRQEILRAADTFFLTNNAASELRAQGYEIERTYKNGEPVYRLVQGLADGEQAARGAAGPERDNLARTSFGPSPDAGGDCPCPSIFKHKGYCDDCPYRASALEDASSGVPSLRRDGNDASSSASAWDSNPPDSSGEPAGAGALDSAGALDETAALRVQTVAVVPGLSSPGVAVSSSASALVGSAAVEAGSLVSGGPDALPLFDVPAPARGAYGEEAA